MHGHENVLLPKRGVLTHAAKFKNSKQLQHTCTDANLDMQ